LRVKEGRSPSSKKIPPSPLKERGIKVEDSSRGEVDSESMARDIKHLHFMLSCVSIKGKLNMLITRGAQRLRGGLTPTLGT